MATTRMQDKIDELEKSHATMATTIEGLSSKMDEIHTLLQQLLNQQPNPNSPKRDDSSILDDGSPKLKSKVLDEDTSSGNPPEDNLCAVKRVEMPSFNGDDPLGWLARVEQYFSLKQTSEIQKIEIVFMSMEGDALHWLQWLRQQNPSLSWAQLKIELMEQFGNDVTASPYEQLVALRQTDSVDEFINEFHARAAQIPLLDPHLQLGIFLNGLQDEIRVKFRPNDAGDLRSAIRVARSIERELDFYKGHKDKPPDRNLRRFKDKPPDRMKQKMKQWWMVT